MTYFEAIKKFKWVIRIHRLDPSVAVYLLQRRLKWSSVKLLMNYRHLVPAPVLKRYRHDVNLYLKGWPPQYIIGTAPFYGYNFRVTPAVLIPRPETEELVDWLLADAPNDSFRVLDLGTGSGAIAISLKLQRPAWHVTATDISRPALNIAKFNAKNHHAEINFYQTDLFKGLPKHYFNFIISNPPYVARSEIPEVDPEVINYEPHVALFAKDHGLWMYKRIVKAYRNYLTSSGKLYLEIGFRQGPAVSQIFKASDSRVQVVIRRDLAGHDRMVRVYLK